MGATRINTLWLAAVLAVAAAAPIAAAGQDAAPAGDTRLDEMNAQVEQLYNQGQYAEAMPIAAEALKAAETAYGPDDFRVARELNDLAEIDQAQARYDEAAQLLERSLSICEKAMGSDHPVAAMYRNNLAGVYKEQGKFAQAEALYQSSLTIFEKNFGPDDPFVAMILNNLAALDLSQGRYAQGQPLAERSLAIAEKQSAPDDAHIDQVLNTLAMLYAGEGKYAEAEPLFRRSLAIRERLHGADHPSVAIALGNLASLLDQEGKYAEAEPLVVRALHIDEKALGPDHPNVATGLGILADIYQDEGKYTQAEPLYQRSRAIYEKAYGPDSTRVAAVLGLLANLYNVQGKYALAEPLYQQALGIDKTALGVDDPRVAEDLNNLATVNREQNRYAEAEPLFQQALTISEKTLGPDHPEVAAYLGNLADLYEAEGKYAQAEPLFQRSLGIAEKALGDENPSVATNLNNLAILYDVEGKWADAEPVFARALDNLFAQFQYNSTFMTEKDRLSFLDTVSFDFTIYFSFVHRYQEKDPALRGAMYNLLLWQKGFVVSSIAGMRRQIEASGDKEAIDLLNQLAAKRTQIAALLSTKPPDLDQWRKQIEQLRAEADAIENNLVARSAAFAQQQKLDRVTWQQVRDALAPNEAAVEFARFRYYDKKWTDAYYYVALVVTRETKDAPRYIVLGDSKQIEGDALTPFQQSVQARGLDERPEASLPGAQAYGLIWQPLESALKGKSRIYISPDGALNQIPLGLVPAPDGQLLMEHYDLRLLSSTRDILRTQSAPSANTALLVGDPSFDLSEDQQRAALEKLALPQPPADLQIAALSPNGLSRDAAGSGSQLPRLPGTGAEVNAIAGLMQQHGWQTGVYLQQTALKRVVEQASSPRVLHLATHGFFLPDQQIKMAKPGQPSGLEDPMLRSGLYFAGADRALAGQPTAEGLDNGVLTAMEAGNLNLAGTELVVLSACNTGQGDVINGEGVFGLRRALEEAGAHAVLMSLWSVPDKETQELMQLFYAKWLSGVEMHEALKEAQLEMREKVKSEHDGRDLPYYWGAFVLAGR